MNPGILEAIHVLPCPIDRTTLIEGLGTRGAERRIAFVGRVGEAIAVNDCGRWFRMTRTK